MPVRLPETYTSSGGGEATLPEGTASQYSAPITNSTGATITAATHGMGATNQLIVAIYQDNGNGTSTPLLCDVTVADNGDVTWAVDEAIDTGLIVIMGVAA